MKTLLIILTLVFSCVSFAHADVYPDIVFEQDPSTDRKHPDKQVFDVLLGGKKIGEAEITIGRALKREVKSKGDYTENNLREMEIKWVK